MTREQIYIGDMSHETAIGILKLMLEAMETYDGISPTPERINAVKMAIKALEQEPRKGHWIVAKGSYLGMRNACCSNCEDFFTNDWNAMNYCPNCGADMREVNNGNDDSNMDNSNM